MNKNEQRIIPVVERISKEDKERTVDTVIKHAAEAVESVLSAFKSGDGRKREEVSKLLNGKIEDALNMIEDIKGKRPEDRETKEFEQENSVEKFEFSDLGREKQKSMVLKKIIDLGGKDVSRSDIHKALESDQGIKLPFGEREEGAFTGVLYDLQEDRKIRVSRRLGRGKVWYEIRN